MKPISKIGCIIMASGLSVRFGRNKLMEKLGGRELVLITADHARQAGYNPVTVTRSREVKELLDRYGFRCVLHDKTRKSDTMHIGMKYVEADAAGYCFWPADQPLVLPETAERLGLMFLSAPEEPVRLGYGNTCGSPVIFPASLRTALLSYQGDRGGIEVLRKEKRSCRVIRASHAFELWDADTPEKMEQLKKAYECLYE